MKALLIIDMLNDFLDEKGKLFCGKPARRIIPVVKRIIDKFHKNGLPVIYACDRHKKDDIEFGLFPPHCVIRTWGAQVIDEISPAKKDIVIYKTTYDAYYKSGLGSALKRLKVNDVYLTGVCTSICIMETASSLAKRGYKLYVYKKAVADLDKPSHRFALTRMQKIYGVNIGVGSTHSQKMKNVNVEIRPQE